MEDECNNIRVMANNLVTRKILHEKSKKILRIWMNISAKSHPPNRLCIGKKSGPQYILVRIIRECMQTKLSLVTLAPLEMDHLKLVLKSSMCEKGVELPFSGTPRASKILKFLF